MTSRGRNDDVDGVLAGSRSDGVQGVRRVRHLRKTRRRKKDRGSANLLSDLDEKDFHSRVYKELSPWKEPRPWASTPCERKGSS